MADALATNAEDPELAKRASAAKPLLAPSGVSVTDDSCQTGNPFEQDSDDKFIRGAKAGDQDLKLEQLLRQNSKTSFMSTYELVKDKISTSVQARFKQQQQQKSQDSRLRYVTGLLFLTVVLIMSIAYVLYTQRKGEVQFFEHAIYEEKTRILRLLDSNNSHLIGLSLATSIPHKLKPFDCTKYLYADQQDRIKCLEWHNKARVTITHSAPLDDVDCYRVYWQSLSDDISPKDCFANGIEYVVPSSDPEVQADIEAKYLPQGQWYGGGESLHASWPLQKGRIKMSAFVTGDEGQTEWGNAIRKYFVNSLGVSLTVADETPLFISINDFPRTGLCVEARFDDFAYYYHRFHLPRLNYTVCTNGNVKKIHFQQLPKSFWDGHKQRDLDTLHHLLQTPIWQVPPDQAASHDSLQKYLERLARDLDENSAGVNESYPNGYLLLDYHWQQHMGDLTFKKDFPDIQSTVNLVRSHGLKLVLTISPFICTDSVNFLPLLEQNLFITQRNASANVPALTWFKDVVSAGMIDITSNKTALWLRQRMRELLTQLRASHLDHEFDSRDHDDQAEVSFFLQTGNAFHTPSYFKFEVPLSNPDLYRDLFVRHVMEEVPVIGVSGATSMRPKAPAFVFLSPLEPRWSHLQSIIPNVLQLSIIGYPFVNTGPVGGTPALRSNQTGEPDSKSEDQTLEEMELFIRWWQLSTFMPMLHFITPPSAFPAESVGGISKYLRSIRQRVVMPELIKFANEAMHSSQPIIRPLWMMDPKDPLTHIIDDEFMIGDSILVAPILSFGQRSRDVYLPIDENDVGDTVVWKRGSDGTFFKGGRWLNNTRVNLNEILYFIKQESNTLPGLG